jgi:CRP-like cAMP-binding protein
MLTLIDPPQEIMDFYTGSKIPVTQVAGIVSSSFLSTSVEAQTDLASKYPNAVIYLRSGILKYFYKGKLIRFHSTGDLILTPPPEMAGVSIICEFGAEATVVPREEFLRHLQEDENLLKVWLEYEQRSTAVIHAICSLYIAEDFSPVSDIRQYDAGTVIIREGDSPDMLFEMLEGSAEVTSGGRLIGEVGEDEVFGEVSFLTGDTRSATVTARTRCLVQVISRPDLEKISKFRPALMYKLAQTLAQRLTEVNKRLISLSSLT